MIKTDLKKIDPAPSVDSNSNIRRCGVELKEGAG
jgi:hypothetical protein